MFCTQCGAQNPDNNSFCTSCGARLATASLANLNPMQNAAEPGATTQIASASSNPQPAPQTTPFNAPQQPIQQHAPAQPNFSAQPDPRYTMPISQAVSIPQASQNPTPAPITASAPQAAPEPQPAAPPQGKSVHEVMGTSQPMPQVAPPAAQPIASNGDKEYSKKRGKNKLIIPIVAAIVILLGIGIATFITDGFGLIKVSPKGSVNEYSWRELSKISSEISKAESETAAIDVAKEYNLVGKDGKLDGTQTKDVTLSNGLKASVMITGFNHDEKTKGGKAGLTFIFTDAIYSNSMNASDSNVGGWEKSQMRSWLASDGMKMLPEDLQKTIVEVEKKTNNTGQTTSTSSVTSTSDKLWLFSPVELCGSVNWNEKDNSSYDKVLDAEGKQYSAFKNIGVIADKSNKSLIRKLNGSANQWWTRSPHLTESQGFYEGNKEGFMGAHVTATSSKGVVPGFCL